MLKAPQSVALLRVDVWPFRLSEGDGRPLRDRYLALAHDEQSRADRYRFERDRTRYIIGRYELRNILGRYLAVSAEEVTFAYNPQGKPELVDRPDVTFNLAHHDDQALLVLTRGVDIGVDVEALRPGFADDSIAEHFFAPEEVAVLRHLPLVEQELAFFRCWTRKEALLKAKGGGLSIALDAFEVAFAPGETPRLLRSRLEPDDVVEWQLLDLSDFVPGHVAALAVRAPNRRLIVQLQASQKD